MSILAHATASPFNRRGGSTLARTRLVSTGATCLNLVEPWLRELTTKRIRRGIFTSVPALILAITGYIAEYNAHPKPFPWTATADEILRKINRCKESVRDTTLAWTPVVCATADW